MESATLPCLLCLACPQGFVRWSQVLLRNACRLSLEQCAPSSMPSTLLRSCQRRLPRLQLQQRQHRGQRMQPTWQTSRRLWPSASCLLSRSSWYVTYLSVNAGFEFHSTSHRVGLTALLSACLHPGRICEPKAICAVVRNMVRSCVGYARCTRKARPSGRQWRWP